ncbi:MAG: hypothetical protein KAR21_12720 [Spirochaetales bacterium]|nr:hypothetical protein [Spirochaetales bacterium]
MDKIIALLSELNGVFAVAQIADNNRTQIIDLENSYEKRGGIGLQNLGIRMVLECDIVFAILKDASFRPPPEATVFMVEDQDNDRKETDHLLKIREKEYCIIGEELIGKTPSEKEDYMFISDDFVLYPERRIGRGKTPAYFLIPPIGFPELEAVRIRYKIENIISISPSSMADDYIRELCSFSLKNEFATILVGFDNIPY